ncbi:MAG: tRNA (guanosine(37)-N1)-methyltransferase TrmD [Erysipelotrichaceae bacterium]|nr:tRNA (guanosine(37)-N1)-methyltransferase TrmD [Erysipelotrichaceae bacterium]
MKITILSLFPEQFNDFVNTSIIKRAISSKIVEVEVINFRDYSNDRLKRVDDAPYGGGAGMILKLQPILSCLKTIKKENSKVYLMSAKGKLYNQKMAHNLAKEEHIILICGHYEGVDDRILNYIDGEICIGDYILTGGEVAAMVVADSIIRLLDGAINNESIKEESFENNLLEYPQFTTPRVYENYKVPDILFSGNHKAINEYRFKQSVIKTLSVRPELLDKTKFNKEQKKWFDELENDSSEITAINKAKKFMKK